MLEYKPDFEEAAGFWEDFWNGENTRPAVSAVFPKPGVTPVERPNTYALLPGRDPDPVIDQLLAWASTHEFLAEAIPLYYLEFAAAHTAAVLGADLVFTEAEPGGWAVPFVQDLHSAEIRFQRDGIWWRRTVELAEALRERCDGKILIASPTLAANLDALAAIHGSRNLLLAMMDNPDAVHRALVQIDQAHGEILNAFSELLDYPRYGCISRHGMYSRGRVNVPQCDFSCMISTDLYRGFAVPYLTREMQRLDAAEYHLDGPGALRHLEALCEIEELDVVQWQPGAGNAEAQDWTWLHDRIDSLGKGQLLGGTAAEVEALWQKYESKKLFFRLSAGSRAEVEDCLAELERITSDKPNAGDR